MKYNLTIFLFFTFVSFSIAQVKEPVPASEILHQMEKLQNTTRVLYVAAHPDDENTRFIAYVENGKKFEAAYLSLTRGDGGQNVIGPELREGLGLIRTQELLAAREIDGGQQFFTRANDFGYSKNPSETFNKWGKEEVLSDAIWTIRNFQPDIIVTRFNKTPGITHGHHTASAILAHEAFKMAGDKTAFPEQLEFTNIWQPKKIYWNTSSWFFRRNEDFDKSQYVTENAGGYSPLLGISYTEMAALSRSRHKSQAFGTAGSRGDEIEYFEFWDGPENAKEIFNGVDHSWSKFKNGKTIQKAIDKLVDDFEPKKPEASIDQLFVIKQLIEKLDDSAVKNDKLKAIEDLILNCAGFYHLFYHDHPYISPGDQINLNMELVNRSDADLKVIGASINAIGEDLDIAGELSNNDVKLQSFAIKIPEDFPYSNPYWLDDPSANGLYKVENQKLIGKAENDPAIIAEINLSINGNKFSFSSPLKYKSSDRISGEIIQPLYVIPPLSIEFGEEVSIFTNTGQEKEISIKVKALKDNISGLLELDLPAGWKAETDQLDLSFENLVRNSTKEFKINLTSGGEEGKYDLRAFARIDEKSVGKSVQEIQYDHIPNQIIIRNASQKLVLADVKTKGKKIAYIEGAGDAVDEALVAMGYQVDFINIESISIEELKQYDAVVAGIRAYNVNSALQVHYGKMNDYMNSGGVYMVQYNTTYSLPDTDFWPYPLDLSRDRITVEQASMEFINPDHSALNYPNKITAEDFEGWVQERGLYFPDKWDKNYVPILAGNDPDETTKKGALLIADYGKGKFVYTGLSFFRELPAGVPGAYRLLANLLARNSNQ
ncbi:PIG-L domain-containing protein [Marivirga tractuosa]|uniref:LmbE family protein n=1 Tax=Marivirga tractuosa (strain ATCC 23168 / DSM 4126 / NBRC 15989 / NCIMB 1408 / VKM B-1430 / H-43) TaxID=643867 RepID=E4TL79_MARTH|nr:PIG-L family deacetylase [Marivirga tractuosa]ADR20217.1 LmbE family protein [Marivirga tractuosa DSM 4126]BDD15342.1 PIG-L domain-containing protein [Marivirga tractuosa]